MLALRDKTAKLCDCTKIFETVFAYDTTMRSYNLLSPDQLSYSLMQRIKSIIGIISIENYALFGILLLAHLVLAIYLGVQTAAALMGFWILICLSVALMGTLAKTITLTCEKFGFIKKSKEFGKALYAILFLLFFALIGVLASSDAVQALASNFGWSVSIAFDPYFTLACVIGVILITPYQT